MPAIVVTATDTDAGKSVVSAAIVAGAKAKGIRASYLKPFASGCYRDPEGRLISEDAAFVAQVCGIDIHPASLGLLCLERPLAPLVAAREEGVRIDWEGIIGRTREEIARSELCVVEGVGGVMVPVAEGKLFIDFLAELGLAAIVVARAGLGTINHTLLTLEALRGRGLEVAGVVMNQPSPSPPDPSAATNPGVIEEFGKVKVLGRIGFMPEVASGGPEAARALAQAGGALKLGGVVEGW